MKRRNGKERRTLKGKARIATATATGLRIAVGTGNGAWTSQPRRPMQRRCSQPRALPKSWPLPSRRQWLARRLLTGGRNTVGQLGLGSSGRTREARTPRPVPTLLCIGDMKVKRAVCAPQVRPKPVGALRHETVLWVVCGTSCTLALVAGAAAAAMCMWRCIPQRAATESRWQWWLQGRPVGCY